MSEHTFFGDDEELCSWVDTLTGADTNDHGTSGEIVSGVKTDDSLAMASTDVFSHDMMKVEVETSGFLQGIDKSFREKMLLAVIQDDGWLSVHVSQKFVETMIMVLMIFFIYGMALYLIWCHSPSAYCGVKNGVISREKVRRTTGVKKSTRLGVEKNDV
eukprot:TRINITY_DN52732_c0_g1_i1.p1 TRINITY_DN52732_c0_g1~~TRINITY_DN52732_c0_g1_i1.p1  ORF type:complete len:159 (+),score=10.56 TRINITY_DN52732_c0_g1_i1:191-667(+)